MFTAAMRNGCQSAGAFPGGSFNSFSRPGYPTATLLNQQVG